MAADFTIQEASPADLPNLRQLDQSTGHAVGRSDADYLNVLDEPLQRIVLHVRSPQELAGFLVARGAAGDWDLENIVIRPSYRRLGLAERLLRHLIDVLKDKASDLRLEVRASNAAAIALYKKCGFQQRGLRKDYYSKPTEDALLFSLPIRKSS